MAENRLIGDYPVIGIRPTIDGRRGPLKVRESLEDQTMGMAKAAAKSAESPSITGSPSGTSAAHPVGMQHTSNSGQEERGVRSKAAS